MKDKTAIYFTVLLVGGAICLFLYSLNNILNRQTYENRMSYDGRNYSLTTVDFSEVNEQLGMIDSDTTITRSYSICNIGNDSLYVLFVAPDCNCTGYHLSENKVAPNDTINITIDIDMREKHKGKFMLNTIVGLNTQKRLYRICIEGDVT